MGAVSNFLITHPLGNVVFDTGPHPDVFKDAFARWGGFAKILQPVGNESCGVLSQPTKIEIQPDSIRYVVNSHLHFDHVGGNEFFTDATFVVSGKELAFAKSSDSKGHGYIRWEPTFKKTCHGHIGELSPKLSKYSTPAQRIDIDNKAHLRYQVGH